MGETANQTPAHVSGFRSAPAQASGLAAARPTGLACWLPFIHCRFQQLHTVLQLADA